MRFQELSTLEFVLDLFETCFQDLLVKRKPKVLKSVEEGDEDAEDDEEDGDEEDCSYRTHRIKHCN